MIDRASLRTLDDEIERSAQSRRSLKTAYERLDDVARLPNDWDSYGAACPAAEAIAAAHALLTALWNRGADAVDRDAAPWAVAPLADGGVQLEWRGGDGAIEVEIAPGGTLNYLVERAERTIRRSDPNRGAPRDEVLAQVEAVLDCGSEP